MTTHPAITLGKRITLLIPAPGMHTVSMCYDLLDPMLIAQKIPGRLVWEPNAECAQLSPEQAERIDNWLKKIFIEQKGELKYSNAFGYKAHANATDYRLVRALCSCLIQWPTPGTVIAITGVFELLHPTTQVLLLEHLLSFAEYPLLICSHSGTLRMSINVLVAAHYATQETLGDENKHRMMVEMCKTHAPAHAWLAPGDLNAYDYLQDPPASIIDLETNGIGDNHADAFEELLGLRFIKIYSALVAVNKQ